MAGHTEFSKLEIFLNKPAPIQATWLGYNGSTGIPEIDYCIGDKIAFPSDTEKRFVEKIWHLPEVMQCLSKPSFDLKIQQTSNAAIPNDLLESSNQKIYSIKKKKVNIVNYSSKRNYRSIIYSNIDNKMFIDYLKTDYPLSDPLYIIPKPIIIVAIPWPGVKSIIIPSNVTINPIINIIVFQNFLKIKVNN